MPACRLVGTKTRISRCCRSLWRCGRAVECTSLENWPGFTPFVSSNLTASAKIRINCNRSGVRTMLRKILAVSLMSVASLAAADTLDIGLSNSTEQFKYGVPSSITSKSEMYAELMFNDRNSILGGVGLLVANDELNVPGLTIGVGAKALAATLKETPSRKNVSAVALGAQVRYELPVERRVAFAGEVYYAPDIIT